MVLPGLRLEFLTDKSWLVDHLIPSIKPWSTTTGSLELTLFGHSSLVWPIAFNHKHNMLASGTGDNTIKLWLGGASNSVLKFQFKYNLCYVFSI